MARDVSSGVGQFPEPFISFKKGEDIDSLKLKGERLLQLFNKTS